MAKDYWTDCQTIIAQLNFLVGMTQTGLFWGRFNTTLEYRATQLGYYLLKGYIESVKIQNGGYVGDQRICGNNLVVEIRTKNTQKHKALILPVSFKQPLIEIISDKKNIKLEELVNKKVLCISREFLEIYALKKYDEEIFRNYGYKQK